MPIDLLDRTEHGILKIEISVDISVTLYSIDAKQRVCHAVRPLA